MGKQTKNFRQTAQSRGGDYGARNYNQQNRGPWHVRMINFIKTRGKGQNYG